MHQLYLLSVLLHILAATAWVGGILFLVLVVVPWLRTGGQANAGPFLRETGQRFRWVAWTCFAVLFTTGTFQLWTRGVRMGDFLRAEWLATPFGMAVVLKLGVFVAVLLVSLYHDFLIGPRATLALQENPASPESTRLRRQASLLGRLNGLLALALVAIAVSLVRGCPW
jgi:uncharacterized membrane protein